MRRQPATQPSADRRTSRQRPPASRAKAVIAAATDTEYITTKPPGELTGIERDAGMEGRDAAPTRGDGERALATGEDSEGRSGVAVPGAEPGAQRNVRVACKYKESHE